MELPKSIFQKIILTFLKVIYSKELTYFQVFMQTIM